MIAMKAVHLGGKDWDAHVSDGYVFGHGHAATWKDAIEEAIANYFARKKKEELADHVS